MKIAASHTIENVMDAYMNDGLVYCVRTSTQGKVKFGKTKLNTRKSMDQVETDLLRRYSTYYGNDAVIVRLIRVGNLHKAEEFLFRAFETQHVSHELYCVHNDDQIKDVFEQVKTTFPTWIDMLGTISCLEERVQMETIMNKTIRALDLQTWMESSMRKSVCFKDIVGL